ncbi:hypothetical protein ACN2C7_17850 [Caulobacter sp. ErkDOM-E]|uniref:hypothetical protein n=1 Tax=Caulobacter sp. ErkDOM-E TaxID=3402778 RepID=UPI003AF70C9D
MHRVSLSLRLTRTQDASIQRHAEAHGITRYQAAIRVMEAGLATIMASSTPTSSDGADVAAAIGELVVRAAVLERLIDRTLYTSAAAYTFARQAALSGAHDPAKLDQALSEAAGEAYRRQRDLARGER